MGNPTFLSCNICYSKAVCVEIPFSRDAHIISIWDRYDFVSLLCCLPGNRPHSEGWGEIMFSHLSFSLSMGGGHPYSRVPYYMTLPCVGAPQRSPCTGSWNNPPPPHRPSIIQYISRMLTPRSVRLLWSCNRTVLFPLYMLRQ